MPIILPPTRSESVFRSFGYFFLGNAGIWVIFNPPSTVENKLGLLTIIWGICLLSSFVAGLYSLRHKYRVEYVALPLTITGAAIYASTVWAMVPDVSTRGPQALFITVVVCMLIIRLITLHRLVVSWKGKPWIGSDQSSRALPPEV